MIDIFGCLYTNQIMLEALKLFSSRRLANVKHSFNFPVLPEYPVVLNRWGRQLNGTTLGPKEEVIA